MPLHPGHSNEVREKNIQEMILSGHDPKQAVAAAYAHQRKYQKMADGGMAEKIKDETNDQQTPSEIPVDDEMVARAMAEKETGYAMGGTIESDAPRSESHFAEMAKKAIEARNKKGA